MHHVCSPRESERNQWTEGTWPRSLGRYKLLRPVGCQKGIESFVATQSGPGGVRRPCLVRATRRSSLSHQGLLDSPLINEARILSRLGGSRIARMYDFFETDDYLVLVLEYSHALDLEVLMKVYEARSMLLPLDLVWLIAKEVFEGLASAHDNTGPDGLPSPILHRDVRPSNILIVREGEVRLMGFWSARQALENSGEISRSVTSRGVQRGTRHYMAPDIAAGLEATERSDVYSAALIVWELLAGCSASPVLEETEEALLLGLAAREMPAISSLRPGIPMRLAAVLDGCLLREPADRTITAREAASWLSQVVRPTDAALALRAAFEQTAVGASPEDHNAAPRVWLNALPPTLVASENASDALRRWEQQTGSGPSRVGLATADLLRDSEPPASAHNERSSQDRTGKSSTAPFRPPRKRRAHRWLAYGLAFGAAGTAAAGMALLSGSPKPSPTEGSRIVAASLIPATHAPPREASLDAPSTSVDTPAITPAPVFGWAASLRVRSPRDGVVYVHGVARGNTDEWVAAPCGRKYVRIGKPGPNGITWLSVGRSVHLQCGLPLELTLPAEE